MRVAVTREVSASIDRCELSYRERVPIDVKLARQQHLVYERTLKKLGLHVISLPALGELPDAVFVEDTAVVLDEIAVLATMGATSRRPEVEHMAATLRSYRPLERLPSGATLEGGDVLHADRTLYVGLTRRTNQAGVDGLRALLTPHGYRVLGVVLSGCLHLKSACSFLGDGRLLINRQWADAAAFEGLTLVDLPPAEPDGGNVLAIDASALLPTAYPRTGDLLERLGWTTSRIDCSELLKAESGVTCGSIVFEA